MKKYCVGIDNGGTGSMGIIDLLRGKQFFYSTPTKTVRDYQVEKKTIVRLDHKVFKDILLKHIDPTHTLLIMERPLVNPTMFQASIHAVRCMEAQLVIIEDLGIEYDVIDSKVWQKLMLPKGTTGTALKQKSFDIGLELYPHLVEKILKQNEADGLLIAEYCKRYRCNI